MSAKIEMLPVTERVRILSQRLANLENGSGDFRPSNRVMAIKECRRKLAGAKSDMRGLN